MNKTRNRELSQWKTELSEYAKWHLSNLGFNFKNTRTGETLRKSEMYDRYGTLIPDEWEKIKYVPLDNVTF